MTQTDRLEFNRKVRAAIIDRAKGKCEACEAPLKPGEGEVDHILPAAKGGLDETANWALACRVCNLRKSDAVDGVDPLTNQRVLLFHPREQVWHEHFDTQGDPPVLLVGKTATGRVTVERLQLNTAVQQAARVQWITLGLFP